MGSKLARLACGTNRSVLAAAPCEMAGAGNAPAADRALVLVNALRKVLRSMRQSPMMCRDAGRPFAAAAICRGFGRPGRDAAETVGAQQIGPVVPGEVRASPVPCRSGDRADRPCTLTGKETPVPARDFA